MHRDSEFRMIQDQHREKMKAIWKKEHREISELLLKTHQMFESHPPEIQKEWRNFVENRIDQRLEDGLKRAVKQSLMELCRTLNGDAKTEPSPLFKVNAVLDQSKMDFKPTMNQLKELLQVINI